MGRAFPLVTALVMAGCIGVLGDAPETDGPVDSDASPAPARMVRLTAFQVGRSYMALLGDDLVLPELPPDDGGVGFRSVSAAASTVAPREAEIYEAAAYAVLDQVWAEADRRDALVGCAPDDLKAPCVDAFLENFVERAWRRPPRDDELSRLRDLARSVEARLRAPTLGLKHALAAVLQSPHFLFQIAVGEPDARGRRRYTSWEMASRLAYLFTDGPPDEASRAAARAGSLVDPEGVRREARRLVDGPAARLALGRFFREWLGLERLDDLDKDPGLFSTMSPSLGASMRMELERQFEEVVFDEEGDLRQLLTTRDTFVNEELAAIYGLEGIEGPELRPVRLPDDMGRAGLLTSPGFLALQAHRTETSPTRRGRFVRRHLLCEEIPSPPPGADTTLPDGTDAPQTLRERLTARVGTAACRSCHQKMDPIGFGLEHYDAVGAWRDMDRGLPVDAASDLDGRPFDGAVALATMLASDARVGPCIARHLYRHATSHHESPQEEAYVDALARAFARSGYDLKELVVQVVVSDGFRYLGEEEGA